MAAENGVRVPVKKIGPLFSAPARADRLKIFTLIRGKADCQLQSDLGFV